MTDSFLCTTEADTTVYSNYTSIKKKKRKRKSSLKSRHLAIANIFYAFPQK